MTFEELNLSKPLLNALNNLGYLNPTPIQQNAFSGIMSGKDLVGIAQTGTGKTFAYLLPLLKQIKFSKQGDPQILVVVPTRELVLQIIKAIQSLTSYISIRAVGVYGGTNIHTQKKSLYDGLDILVATPGRLIDLIMARSVKTKAIKKFVIDEVDEIFNKGFRAQFNNILDLLPPKRQNIMFSATMTNEVKKLIKNTFNEPQMIQVASIGIPIEKITQKGFHVPNFQTKVNLLALLLSQNEDLSQVLVFVGNKKLANLLYEKIEHNLKGRFGIIHSNKSQNHRINTVREFHEGKYRVLIATDIIARGIDFSEITHVINFDTPEEPENYIHRIGRTGRADKTGEAITFISDTEQEYQMQIEILMNKPIPLESLPKDLEIAQNDLDKKPLGGNKNYLQTHSLKDSQSAFHEKLDKNKKVNQGGSYRRKLKEKYKKPIRRSGKKK